MDEPIHAKSDGEHSSGDAKHNFMTVRHTPEPHQAVTHDREVKYIKCPHCKHELPEGVDIAVFPNLPWMTVCAKCPFCDVGLSFFVMPMEEQAPASQPS